jgi:hypothetical protein
MMGEERSQRDGQLTSSSMTYNGYEDMGSDSSVNDDKRRTDVKHLEKKMSFIRR